jgi:hypothetical protein
MASRYLSHHVQFGMSILLRNLNDLKAYIQIQKTEAEACFYSEISARF